MLRFLICMCVLFAAPAPSVSQGLEHAASDLRSVDELVAALNSQQRSEWTLAAERLGARAAADPQMMHEVWAKAGVNTLGMRFVKVHAGTFVMGPDVHRFVNPQISHKVKLTRPYLISATEVTNAQFDSLMDRKERETPYSPDPDSPALKVMWDDAVEFCQRLSKREGVVYRLPTEAEWEYACRAGGTSKFCYGNDARLLHEYGFCDASYNRALQVARLKPNAWGIFDMHGNAVEWVQDLHSDTYYQQCAALGVVEDPKGPSEGWTHVLRGGAWDVRNPSACSCTARFPLPIFDKKPFSGDVGFRDHVGFRIVREFHE